MLGGQSWLGLWCEIDFFFSYCLIHRFVDILICCFWGVLLQNWVMEISLCNLFLGYTTTSTSCCFSWYIWEEMFSEYMARFILGPFLINHWTFRFVSSLFDLLVFFSRLLIAMFVLLQHTSYKPTVWNVQLCHLNVISQLYMTISAIFFDLWWGKPNFSWVIEVKVGFCAMQKYCIIWLC